MDKSEVVRQFIEAIQLEQLQLLARLPRRQLSASQKAAAVNAALGNVSEDRMSQDFPDDRVSLAVSRDGRVAGVMGRHIVASRIADEGTLPQENLQKSV